MSFPPYLFECFPFGLVDDRNSKAQVGNGAVTFSIQKKEPGMWSQLQADYKGIAFSWLFVSLHFLIV